MNLQRALLGVVALVGCADIAPEQDALQLQSGAASAFDAGVGAVPRGGALSVDAGVDAATAAPAPPGGGCTYVTSLGTAVIERIEPAGPGVSRCERDPVRVTFRFEPDEGDAAAPGALVDVREGLFTLPSGIAPPRSCIAEAGIQVNSRLRVRRKSMTRGACSPVVFEFDESLAAACNHQCGERR